MDPGRLLHNVFAAEVVAARLEHGDHGLRRTITVNGSGIGDVGRAVILVHPRQPILVFRRVLPLRIGGVFKEAGRDDADAFLGSGRLHHRPDRVRYVGEEVRRLRPDVIDLTDCLGGKFGDSRRQQNICAASLQRHDLRVDRWIGGLIGLG
jgi:hypothetical protein